MLDDARGQINFWVTFLGTYAIVYPMHFMGFAGGPRRYYGYGETAYIPDSIQTLNAFMSVAAIIVALVQRVFFYNLVRSYFRGREAGPNPWQATTPEWQTEHTPPRHGNFGAELPVVYRWAYDYGVPGAKHDFIPQHMPPDEVAKVDPVVRETAQGGVAP